MLHWEYGKNHKNRDHQSATATAAAPVGNACGPCRTKKALSASIRTLTSSWLATRLAMAVRAEISNMPGEEMVNNGAQVIHLATGMVVGYPPAHTSKFSNRPWKSDSV